MNPLFSAASPRARRATATLALLGLATVALAGAAQAAAIAGPGGTAEQGRRQVAFTDPSTPTPTPTPAPAPAARPDAPAPELVSARIDAVHADGRSITVCGKPVPLHGQQLRVLAPGGAALAGARSLRAGMQVRFGLEPEARPAPVTAGAAAAPPTERRIVLIYVDAQP